jgi:hypothetical protein
MITELMSGIRNLLDCPVIFLEGGILADNEKCDG